MYTCGRVCGYETLDSGFVKTCLFEISWKCAPAPSTSLCALLFRPSFPCKMRQLARTPTLDSELDNAFLYLPCHIEGYENVVALSFIFEGNYTSCGQVHKLCR